jgi:hypothetical protein
MTSNQHGPYVLGDTDATMAGTKSSQARNAEPISKSRSQFGLGSETRPHEAGIASNRKSAMLR